MMWRNYYDFWMMPYQGFLPWIIIGPLIFIVLVWSLYWKGRALWRAARQGDKTWFVALLLINTAGILEILYIYIFSKKSTPVE